MNNLTITLYHYTRLTNLDKILSSGLIKLTKITNANDPFEGSIAHPSEKDFRDDPLMQMYNKDVWYRRMNAEPPLVISLSSVMSSPSMWGQYADGHKGVCLVFQIPVRLIKDAGVLSDKERALARAIYPMEYTKKKPSLKILLRDTDVHDYQRMLRESWLHKGKDWEYENEVRIHVAASTPTPEIHNDIVCIREDKYYCGLMGYLSGVILGVRCTKKVEEVNLALKGYKYEHAHAIRADISPSCYKIIAKTSSGGKYEDSSSQVKSIRRYYISNGKGETLDGLWCMFPRKASICKCEI